MSTRYVVLRAIGVDRVGIVGDITQIASCYGCNIEESKMAVLGRAFSVMMLLQGQESSIDALRAHDFSSGSLSDLQVDIIETEGEHPLTARIAYEIESVSLDAPGIVNTVTALLKRRQINIEELETESTAAPFTGSPLFSMNIRISLTGAKQAAALGEELKQLAFDKDLDIRFRPLAGLKD